MNENFPAVLIIDDDVNIGKLLTGYLGSHGFNVTAVHSGKSGIETCKKQNFDYIVCDYRLGDKTGLEVLEAVKELQPEARVIIITAYSDVRLAVNAIKRGAVDFVVKPLVVDELLAILNGQTGYKSSDRAPVHSSFCQTPLQEGYWSCSSLSMREVYDEIDLVAPSDYSIIIYGESGTGKEMVARAIHEKSKRKDHPFVALDCGTLSRELAGSELFGHIKGSFTGAVNDKIGHFELADKGTLFLDEVANLPLDVQAALLRVVQERTFRKIGSGVQQPVDVRILVASNEDLQKSYQAGTFREDLYHRFNEFKINLPPLRKRKEDILPLANHFLALTCNELGKNITGFEHEVEDLFFQYRWPGNLRELKNIVRRAALLTKSGNRISKTSLPTEMAFQPAAMPAMAVITQPALPEEPARTDLKHYVSETQKSTILETLQAVNYNKTKAAHLLKIDRKTLYNKLREFGILLPQPDKPLSE